MVLPSVLILFCLLANGYAQSASTAPIALAVHVLVPCSNRDAGQSVKLPGVEASLCLDRTPFLTQKDVQSAEIHKNSKGSPVVFLTFHEDAALRELEITHKNIGNRVGIVLNGRVVSAPSISASSRFLYIDANYTGKQAQDLAAALNKQAASR
jgi:preprotein translocase subunit SecD